MVTVRRSIWHEPRPSDPPPTGRLDWLLVAGFEVSALVEGIVRPDLTWRPFVTVLAVAMMPALLWRRSHPLPAPSPRRRSRSWPRSSPRRRGPWRR